MKLDEIQDIEVLRNELKKVMVKCIKDLKVDGVFDNLDFKKGEYYHWVQDEQDDFNIHDDKGNYTYGCYIDIYEYFEFPKEGE